MGDRAQIIIERAGTKIHFYTHWRGHMVPRILFDALRRGERWNDDSYLSRIIFCHLVHGQEDESTGFGISTQYQDSCEDTDLIVDMDKQRVRYKSLAWSFEEYVRLSPSTWEDL